MGRRSRHHPKGVALLTVSLELVSLELASVTCLLSYQIANWIFNFGLWVYTGHEIQKSSVSGNFKELLIQEPNSGLSDVHIEQSLTHFFYAVSHVLMKNSDTVMNQVLLPFRSLFFIFTLPFYLQWLQSVHHHTTSANLVERHKASPWFCSFTWIFCFMTNVLIL